MSMYWEMGDVVPERPQGLCVTQEQYLWPNDECEVIWQVWDDYCWWMDYADVCQDVKREVRRDPSLLEPEVPDDHCFVLPISR